MEPQVPNGFADFLDGGHQETQHDVVHPNVSPSNSTPHTQVVILGAQGLSEPQNMGEPGRRSLLQRIILYWDLPFVNF